MKRFLKSFRYGQRGFTLIELLIVVAILGILAAVIVPNLATFLGTGKVAAANTEVANVETAALAYYADNDGAWPSTSDVLYVEDDASASYLSDEPGFSYGFDAWGKVAVTDGALYTDEEAGGIAWNASTHKWEKGYTTS